MFTLGIIVGMLLDITALLVFFYIKPRVIHHFDKIEEHFKPNPRGEVFMESESEEELKAFINSLPNENNQDK